MSLISVNQIDTWISSLAPALERSYFPGSNRREATLLVQSADATSLESTMQGCCGV
jgi:hypothetical protein